LRARLVCFRSRRWFSPCNAGAGQPSRAGIVLSGELKQWHKVTLTLDGPLANERDPEPNPFTDFTFNVTFAHESGVPNYTVPGYFAADGGAADLDLTGAAGRFNVKWFNPRTGGALADGSVAFILGGAKAALGNPPADGNLDWLVVVRR
jgi:hypothetical protein